MQGYHQVVMSYKTIYKSHHYLDYIGDQLCLVTGETHPDVHHESVTKEYSAGLKKYFDFGALPLTHRVHLDERHAWGKHRFWDHYQLNPVAIARELVSAYILLEPIDIDLAMKALLLFKP